MKHVVVGTAGHIDHGKTALVQALTGVNTDRLKEEKERGISIDLGFARFDAAPALRLSIIDVPGHERFIRNMLAGAAGIDIVLFVVAADQSIRPQTREHFEICRLLGISRGVIALTKSDLVEPAILDLVRCEVDDFVRGSFLHNAPVIAVSARTGAGLDDLRSALAAAAASVCAKDASRWFRLPIDRAFSMKGFGTVVTGTLIAGSVAVEDEVELHPGNRRIRVRGVQVHNEPARSAVAGQRAALNLAGIETADLRRGMVLTAPGRFRSTLRLDCSLELLRDAPPLKHRAPVHFHSGAAELVGEVRILGETAALPPGSASFVRILLREPLLALPGDRFILRRFSPVTTIGGGEVLDIAPPRRAPVERLGTLHHGAAPERIALLVRESDGGLGASELVARSGLRETEIAKAAREAGLVMLPGWFVHPAWFSAKANALREELARFHSGNPLLSGMPREELRARIGVSALVFDALLAVSSDIAILGDLARLASHRAAMRDDEAEASRRIEAAFEKAGLEAPSPDEVVAACGLPPARARTLLHLLLRDRTLIPVGAGLIFHASAIARVRNLLAARKGVRFTVGDFKSWTGVSRKYAIPLLEYFDRDRITRREGDARVVL